MALIVDMRMPSCCGSCRASGTDVCKSWFGFLKHLGEGRPIGCPILGEIPDKHGALIDRDFLLKYAVRLLREDGCDLIPVDDIEGFPVVVEASR